MTYRAVEELRAVDQILAEDTRHSARLLDHYDIRTRVTSYHDHNKERVTPGLVENLVAGARMALITDAGTPGISDPGFYLVRASIAAGVDVTAVPGASALLPALVVSGLGTDAFVFSGFAPRKKGALARAVEALADEKRTSLFYVSPYKLLGVLEVFREKLPGRTLVIARELTKAHEEIRRGRASELIAHYEKGRVRGEIVLVVSGKTKCAPAA